LQAGKKNLLRHLSNIGSNSVLIVPTSQSGGKEEQEVQTGVISRHHPFSEIQTQTASLAL
jgi:hypothetical protein